jgi:Mu transposase, C-terminal domain
LLPKSPDPGLPGFFLPPSSSGDRDVLLKELRKSGKILLTFFLSSIKQRSFVDICSVFFIGTVHFLSFHLVFFFESQVLQVRGILVLERLGHPRPKVKDFKELNAFLLSRCIGWAKTCKHPTIQDKMVWEVYEEERSHLISLQLPFDGYAERPARVSPTSLITFDRNCYSVHCSQVGRTVQVRVYADRIVIVREGKS